MSFGAPRYLNLLFLLPLAIFLFWIIVRHVEQVRLQFQMEQVLRSSSFSSQFRYVRLTFLFVLGCGSLILALAEPQIEIKREEDVYRKINVVFLLDTSLSMRARDIAPSRIERARQEIQNFILNRRENIGQIGLISFAGTSIILSYLTDDPSNILFYLDYLETDWRPTFGTDIGAGFQNGLVLLEKEQGLDSTLRPEDITFILISDGEDHGLILRQAVQKAFELKVRTYSVGLGTQLGGYIPMGERDGHTVFLVDEEGDKVLATFDEGTLRWVAGATGGRYYRSHTGTELREHLNEILWNERKVIGTRLVTEKTPLYYWFIVSGFAALAVFFID
ncbi:MAG: VWA domain-containing protein [Acidobacteria bacterium]|nr:VWA domain-containing protein [Acidobacteriota bacterium]